MSFPSLRARRPPEIAHSTTRFCLVLFGALTLTSGAKRLLEGEAAFAIFWLLAGPAALALVYWRERRGGADRAAGPAITAASTALLTLTFAAGAVTGSSHVADLVLGAALLVAGGLVGQSRLTLSGALIVAVIGLLAALGVHDTAAPLATGSLLLATGLPPARVATPRGVPRDAREGELVMRQVDATQAPAAARLCAAAFLDDPAMVGLGRLSERRRRVMLRRWFRGLLRIAERGARRPILGVFIDDRLAAVCVEYEPGSYPAPWWTAAFSAPGPGLAGPRVASRSLRWFVARERAHPGEPHLYLETLATHPRDRSRGAGSLLLERLCDEADARDLPVMLHTNRRDNLAYYRRFGFVVQREAMLPHGVPEWLMRRSPERAAAD